MVRENRDVGLLLELGPCRKANSVPRYRGVLLFHCYFIVISVMSFVRPLA